MQSVESVVAGLVEHLGELSPEQAVMAAVAARLAQNLGEDQAGYVVAHAARELRATVAGLLDAPPVGAGVTEPDWDRILSTPDEPWGGR
jgi:hypothetical protein